MKGNKDPVITYALKEMVAACAAAMRVLDRHKLKAEFADELKVANVEPGFGKRALLAIVTEEREETP